MSSSGRSPARRRPQARRRRRGRRPRSGPGRPGGADAGGAGRAAARLGRADVAAGAAVGDDVGAGDAAPVAELRARRTGAPPVDAGTARGAALVATGAFLGTTVPPDADLGARARAARAAGGVDRQGVQRAGEERGDTAADGAEE